MDPAGILREARLEAGLTQAELARRARTSQATVSAYESGRKAPSVRTLDRLLAACGARLSVRRERPPTPAQQARTGRGLADVLDLAGALPVRHTPELRFPRLPPPRSRA